MGVKNLAELYFGDEFHRGIGESSFNTLYFFPHVLELYLNPLFYFLLMKAQKNRLVVDVKAH